MKTKVITQKNSKPTRDAEEPEPVRLADKVGNKSQVARELGIHVSLIGQ